MSHHAQPETHGAGHHSQAPQVAVRDGNRLLCPCCGEVLMELDDYVPPPPTPEPPNPWLAVRADGKPMPSKMPTYADFLEKQYETQKEAAWKAYEEDQQRKRDELHAKYLASDDPKFCADYLSQPIDPDVAAYEFPDEEPPPLPSSQQAKRPRNRNPKPRPSRQADWQGVALNEPYNYQEKRYLAWYYYHLKIQDLELQEKILAKQAKIEDLRRELDGALEVPRSEAPLPDPGTPKYRPPVQIVEFDLMYWIEKVRREQTWPEYQSICLTAVMDRAKERGPPG